MQEKCDLFCRLNVKKVIMVVVVENVSVLILTTFTI